MTVADGRPGRLTIKQVAALARVSRSTVSRVLNGHASVDPVVRGRVEQIIAEHHYTPRSAARDLVRQRSDLIGLVYPWNMPSDPFFSTVIDGLNETFSGAGYFLMVSLVPPDMRQRFVDRIVHSGHFDGMVLGLGDVDDPALPIFRNHHTPLVLIDHHPAYTELSSVYAANRQGAHAAVSHLIGLGHQRIATIAGPLRMVSAQDRLEGYRRALSDAGIDVDPGLIREANYSSVDLARRVMSELLDRPDRPSAVFAGNDVIAVGALEAIHAAGLRVPGDVAVVGFDDSPLARKTDPPLTTVHQSGHGLGSAAANVLIEHLRQPGGPLRHVELPTHLVIRESCGAPNETAASPVDAGAMRHRVGLPEMERRGQTFS